MIAKMIGLRRGSEEMGRNGDALMGLRLADENERRLAGTQKQRVRNVVCIGVHIALAFSDQNTAGKIGKI